MTSGPHSVKTPDSAVQGACSYYSMRTATSGGMVDLKLPEVGAYQTSVSCRTDIVSVHLEQAAPFFKVQFLEAGPDEVVARPDRNPRRRRGSPTREHRWRAIRPLRAARRTSVPIKAERGAWLGLLR